MNTFREFIVFRELYMRNLLHSIMLEIIVGNAVIKTTIRRRCDCLASSAPFTNIQIYLLTYLLTYDSTPIRLQFDHTTTIRRHSLRP